MPAQTNGVLRVDEGGAPFFLFL